MVNKVLQANKRIAAKSAKQVIKPPPVISTTGFEIPSARKGKSLYDTLNAFKFKTGMDASEYIMNKGLPPISKTGGEQSLELINKIVDPKDKYIKIPSELRDLEKQRYGGDNKKFKLNKMNLSKNLFSIQKEADNLFGTETTKQKIKFIEKAANKMGIVLKDVAKMGFRNLMPALGPVGVVLSIGMSKKANAGEDEFFEQREADRIKQRLMEENIGQVINALVRKIERVETNVDWIKMQMEQDQKHIDQIYKNKDEIQQMRTIGTVMFTITAFVASIFGLKIK